MSEWELFIRGLSKTIEEFFNKMVEKGKLYPDSKKSEAPKGNDDAEIHGAVTEHPLPQKEPEKHEINDIENKILKAIGQFTHGCTMKEIARVLEIQWHFLRIPLRNLIAQKKVFKDGKVYRLRSGNRNNVPEKEPNLFEMPVKRRRVVDAKAWDVKKEEEAKEKAKQLNMTSREKEILKFKILTAFKGRPEGLTLEELAAVLGRTKDGLDIIIGELIDDEKVSKGQSEKYFLV